MDLTFKVNLIKSKDEVLGKVNILKGKKEKADVVLVNDLTEILNVNDKPSNYNFKLEIDKIIAPIKKGKVKVFDENNKLLTSVDITVNENILKANLFDLFKRNLRYSLVWG